MPMIVGSTYRFTLTATKDGETWDISGGTITLTLIDPSGNAADYSASIVSGPAGTARYDGATSLLDEPGMWRRSWTVSVGGVVLESAPILFSVEPSP